MDMQKWEAKLKISGKRFQDHVQQGIVYGVMQYREHGNADVLTRVVNVVSELGIVSPKRLIDFILTHAPTLDWTDAKFKKGEGEGETRIPTMKWWQFKAEPVPQEFDSLAKLKAYVKSARNALKEGRFKGDATLVSKVEALVA